MLLPISYPLFLIFFFFFFFQAEDGIRDGHVTGVQTCALPICTGCQAWQPVLRPSVVKKTWRPIFQRNAQRYLEELKAKGPGADLVWDFAAPYAAENLRAVTGLHNVTQHDLQRWSQTMIDATGNYADDPVVWAKGEASYNEVD